MHGSCPGKKKHQLDNMAASGTSASSSSSSSCHSTPLTSFSACSSKTNKRKQPSNEQPSSLNKRKNPQKVSVVIPHRPRRAPSPSGLTPAQPKSIETNQKDPDRVDGDPDFIPNESSSGEGEDPEEEDRRQRLQQKLKQLQAEAEGTVCVLPIVHTRFKKYFSCLKSVSNDSVGLIQSHQPSFIKLDNVHEDQIHWIGSRWRVSKRGEDFYRSVQIRNHQISINSVVSCKRKTGREFSYRKSRLKSSTDPNYGSDTEEEDEEAFQDSDPDERKSEPVNSAAQNQAEAILFRNNLNPGARKIGRPNLRRFQVRALFERDGVKYFHGTWLEEASHSFVGSAADPNELLLVHKCYEIALKFVTGIEHVAFVLADQCELPQKDSLYCRFHWKPMEGSFIDLPRLSKPNPPNPIDETTSACSICLTIPKKFEWLTDAKTGEILLGQTDQYELLGFKLGGEETYQLNDFVRVSSSSSPTELELIGQIVEICGIRANPNFANTIVIDEAPFRPPPSIYSKLLTRKPVITIRTYSRHPWAGFKLEKFEDDRRLWITSEEVLVDVKNHLKGKCQIVHLVKDHAHHSNSGFVTLKTHRQVNEESIAEKDHCFYSILPTSKQQSNLCSVPIIDEAWQSNLSSREPEWVKIEDEEQGEDYKQIIKSYPQVGKLRHLELFGGIGSMTVALIEFGLASQDETMFIDISLPACHTLSANFPRAQVICADVSQVLQLMVEGKTSDNQDFLIDLRTSQKVHLNDLPRPGDVDLITAGFPCGSHSTLNVLRRANDPKNALCATALSFIAYLKPDYLFFENVRGLLKTSFINPLDGSLLDKAFLRLICGTLISLGYQVRFGVLQAAQFGSPQRRRRIIFAGTRHGLTPIKLPEPTHHFPDEKVAILLPMNEEKGQRQVQTNYCRSVRADYRKFSTGSLKSVTIKDAISDLPGFEYVNPNQVMKEYKSSGQSLEDNLLDCDIDQRKIIKYRSQLIPQLNQFISFSSVLERSKIGLIGFDEFQYTSKPTNRYQVWLRKPLEWKPLVDSFVFTQSIGSSCRCNIQNLSSSSANNSNPSHSLESCSGYNCRIRNWHVTPKFSSKVIERICNIPFKPNADHRSLSKPLRLKNSARFTKCSDYDGNYGRLNYNAQFNTIITAMHPQNQNKCGTVLHPNQNRTLTLLEAQRAQGFPDRFKLEPMIRDGKVIDESISRQLFKMIGNSIPIPISLNLAKSLLTSREADFCAHRRRQTHSRVASSSSSSSSSCGSSPPITRNTAATLDHHPKNKLENLRLDFTRLKACFDCLDLIDFYFDQ